MICPNKNTPEWKALSKAQPKLAYYLWNKYDGAVPSNYYNSSSFVSYQLPNQQKEYIASEKTIRDLAARMSDRIGIPVRFESDRSKQYKGKLEDNVAVVNLAYATLDTPIHEVLGHPIIRAIKDRKYFNGSIDRYNDAIVEFDEKNPKATREEAIAYADKKVGNNQTDLYQNLLKELEYGKGKEILDRVKIDYVYKSINDTDKYPSVNEYGLSLNAFIESGIQNGRTAKQIKEDLDKNFSSVDAEWLFFNYSYGQNFAPEFPGDEGIMPVTTKSEVFDILGKNKIAYTLEEQQEEAIVELLGLYTAERLDRVKDGKLISLLKRLLKEIKAFMKDLLSLDEIEVNKLPDNMTLGDLADLLAYSNSKLILPGNEVIYTTPDNQRFKTYGEASKHISGLARNVKYIDLSNIQLPIINIKNVPKEGFRVYNGETNGVDNPNIIISYNEDKNNWEYTDDDFKTIKSISEKEVLNYYNRFTNSDDVTNGYYTNNPINNFIERNKEYEQAKEIIEEWKKVNNIQYNPEEVYSRGQEFVSVVGAYSDFDVNLMMQNLLQHIEDNQKAGGEFTISAFTRPVDKTIGHLEGGGGKIKFKIYPKSQDIKWASNTDVFSGSVWDASTKVSKDKKSELLGVSYTKYPSLPYVPTVAPNLASIIDKLAHHHNELGISLTGNNFRIEYDDDIPYSTKKIINAVNSILDQKYGKLKKPQIQQIRNFTGLTVNYKGDSSFKTVKSYESDIFRLYDISNGRETIKGLKANEFDFIEKVTNGIQPTQTNETLKESINSVKEKLNENNLQDEDMPFAPKEQRKEYTSQALINTKIAKLKEVAKKYPRSLIRSEVVRTSEYYPGEFSGFAEDELPFQRIPSTQIKPGVTELLESNAELANIGTPQQYSQYLDSIFPESKVQKILYHGTYEKFDKFSKEKLGTTTGLGNYTDSVTGELIPIDSSNAFFFTDNVDTATSYSFKGRNNFINKVENALQSILTSWGSMDKQDAVAFLKTIPYYGNLIETAKKNNKNQQEILDILKLEWNRVRDTQKEAKFNTFTNWKNNNREDIQSVLEIYKNIDKLKNNDPTINIRFGDFTKSSVSRDDFSIYFDRDTEEYLLIEGKNRFKSSDLSKQELEGFLQRFLNIYEKSEEERKLKQKKAGYIEQVLPVVLNIQNPLSHDYEKSSFVDKYKDSDKYTSDYIAARQVKKALTEGKDAVIYENIKDPLISTSYGVFEPEQIHILGNKQDIEGFKQFVSNSAPMTSPDMSNLENTEFEVIKCRED